MYTERRPYGDRGGRPRETMSEGTPGRVPPHNLDAEAAVLGAILLDNASLNIVTEVLGADDFYSPGHRQIFQVVLELSAVGKPVDLVTMTAALKDRERLQAVGGAAALAALVDSTPSIANVEAHAHIVREKATVRRMIDAASEIVARGFGDYGNSTEYIDAAEGAIFQIAKEGVRRPFVHIKQALHETFQAIERAGARGDRITGVATGFAKLDKMTGGLQNSDLIIIAGRPGMGKTSFALNVATHACLKNGTSCAVFSLEMARDQLVRRMLASEARVDQGRLRQGVLSSEEMDRLIQAAGMLAETPLYVDDTGALPVMELRAKARRLKSEANLGLVIVDYLQLMRGPKDVDNREQEISYISQSLKALAKELDIPVIALSQLNRGVENRPGKDKRPQLSDLRESGAIEQDADIIMFVYRDEVYNRDEDANRGLAEIIIGKQRNGPTGVVPCRFFHEFTRFENLADDREYGA